MSNNKSKSISKSIKLCDIYYKNAVDIDTQKIIDFWKNNDITISTSDNIDEINIAKHIFPQLFIIALEKVSSDRKEEKIAGTVWGNFDGRRGFIVHLATRKDLRGIGLGKKLMELVEYEFHKLNCYKVHLFVETHNIKVIDFYEKLGYKARKDVITMSKTLRK